MCVLHAKSLQSCPTLCDPMDCSPPGSSVHGIFQARTLESSRGSSWLRDQTRVSYVSCMGRWVLYHQHHLGSPIVLDIGPLLSFTSITDVCWGTKLLNFNGKQFGDFVLLCRVISVWFRNCCIPRAHKPIFNFFLRQVVPLMFYKWSVISY